MYTRQRKDFIVSPVSPSKVVRDDIDWNTSPTKDKKHHFKNIHALFLDHIKHMGDAQYGLSDHEEKELRHMFDVLIEAKHGLKKE